VAKTLPAELVQRGLTLRDSGGLAGRTPEPRSKLWGHSEPAQGQGTPKGTRWERAPCSLTPQHLGIPKEDPPKSHLTAPPVPAHTARMPGMAASGTATAASAGTRSRTLPGCPVLWTGAVPPNPTGDRNCFSQRVRTRGGTRQQPQHGHSRRSRGHRGRRPALGLSLLVGVRSWESVTVAPGTGARINPNRFPTDTVPQGQAGSWQSPRQLPCCGGHCAPQPCIPS